jgi:hypothetical protein
MRISLNDIEKAIRANFILSKEGNRLLEADYYYEWHALGAARIVFVGAAIAAGYGQQDICLYIDMSLSEYNGKLRKFREHYKRGSSKAAEIKAARRQIAELDAKDIDLRIYRKYVLVNNYLQHLQRKRLELF